MVLIENVTVLEKKFTPMGNGWAIYFDKEMLEYLGIDDPEKVSVKMKADKSSSHGRFLGIGYDKFNKASR